MSKNHKYIIIFFAFITSVFIIAGCADNDFIRDGWRDSSSPLRFRLAIADMADVSVATRGISDSALATLHIAVFASDADDAVMVSDLYEVEDWTLDSDGIITFDITLDENVTDRKNLCFEVLANADGDILPSLAKGVTTRGALRSMEGRLAGSVGSVLAMSGFCRYTDLFGQDGKYIINMRRNVAAVEVSMHGEEEDTPLNFTVYGTPDALSPVAGAEALCAPASKAVEGVATAVANGSTTYIAPLANTSRDNPFARDAKPFIVIETPYNGVTYWYRLSFTALDDESRPVALDVLPNHKYRFLIRSVTAPGYDSAEKAAAGAPSADVDYIIYDIQPQIFNMASDGVAELGASRNILDTLGDVCEKEFQVKCFPAPASADELSFTSAAGWISVDPVPVTALAIEDYTGQAGMLYTFRARLDKNTRRVTRHGRIDIIWNGLDVFVDVEQQRSFIADRHTAVTLDIREADGSLCRRITDYWTFLNGEGTILDPGTPGRSLTAPILYGISAEVNGGAIRTHGLHFPVMNGGRHYEYSIIPDFSAAGGAAYYRIGLSEGCRFASNIEIPSGNIPLGNPATVKFHNDSFDIAMEEGAITIFAYNAAGEEIDGYTLDVYHLGFFDWSDYPDYRSDRTNRPQIEQAWYYYEVIEFATPDGSTYWLDRNLGARSNGFDIIGSDGNTIFAAEDSYPFLGGDGSAAGGIYKRVAAESNTYGDPSRIDSFGPAGYCIPTMSKYNELRDSHSFITSRSYSPAMTTYYTAYYQTPSGRRVYFPKAGQYQDNVLASEGNMGYYWTLTAATGFEKDEIGKWLSTLVISGNSTYFSQARLINPESGMSVRLVNRTDEEETYHQTVWTGMGAPHVFLNRGNV
ncbi:MAG: hypothetical protein K2H35_00090, partial [Muribaculaceae bacterium]|nr:hypothetical protein [Muribaculaceae bacterium]